LKNQATGVAMQPVIERRRTRCLRIAAWIAKAAAAIIVVGGAAFVIGAAIEFRQHSTATLGPVTTSAHPFPLGFLIGAIGLTAALGGLGLLLGSFIGWCVVRRPQFRLRTCFIACLVLAAILACGPHAARIAARAGIRANADEITIRRDYAGGSSSTSAVLSSVEMTFPLNPFLLVPVLLPAIFVTLFLSRLYP
jgi:hypothetical protein